ncbi:MAG: GntR family transcriptional regulator [Eubacterium sp.]|nr:GntR family transcriptional regulator [Eubacterium sp.]
MKYQEIEERLRAMLLAGENVSADGKVIGERELAELFGTSRTTIRKAIDSLCDQGTLRRYHGRGTYVKNIRDTRLSQSLYSVTRCAQYYEEQNLDPKVTLIARERIPANAIIASYLKIRQGDPVVRIRKLFGANRYIFNLTDAYVSLAYFPEAERLDFTDPVCEVLRREFGAVPRRTDNTIEAILPPPEVAALLKIKTSKPVLLFEAITTGIAEGRSVPLEYYKTWHRTDSLRFSYEQIHEAVE